MKGHNSTSVLFASLQSMPEDVARVLSFFSDSDLIWKSKSWDGIPGEKFSAIEQICHLRDIETDGYHNRIQAILIEPDPFLPSVQGYELAKQRNYEKSNLNEAISGFSAAREKTLMIIGGIEELQWDRTGRFEGYGTVTLRALIHFLCSHDLEHLASLRWLLGQIESEKIANVNKKYS